ncbi:MAG TPA: DNA repair protein RadA, partial [Bacillota bacterium]|nr:DNA repair protein RadA [Bacillota bacterium]
MPRFVVKYVCSACGFQSSQWYGRCPECGEWNTLEEQTEEKDKRKPSGATSKPLSPVILAEVEPESVQRFSSGLEELDRALGGGFVPGSLLLIGGEPGIGKSTLL